MSVRKTNVIKAFDSSWDYSISAGDDKATAHLSYKDDFVGWASRCPFLNSEHPDLPGLKLSTIKASREDGEQVVVKMDYVSLGTNGAPGKPPTADGEATAKYYVVMNSSDEHILTSGYASALSETERQYLYAISNGSMEGENGQKLSDLVTSDLGKSLLEKITKGNVSFRMGGVVYGQKRVITSLATLNFPKLGKIDTPPGPVGGSTGRWLYISASAEPVPTDEVAWQADFQWQYSPLTGGWDNDLYGD